MEPRGKPLNQVGKTLFCIKGNLFKINNIEQYNGQYGWAVL